MLQVDSDMIHKIGFDSQLPGVSHGYMVVQFKNLQTYGYEDVEWSDYLQLLNAPSIGAAFTTLVRKKYKSVLLTENDTHVVATKSLDAPKPKPAEDIPLLDFGDARDNVRRKK